MPWPTTRIAIAFLPDQLEQMGTTFQLIPIFFYDKMTTG